MQGRTDLRVFTIQEANRAIREIRKQLPELRRSVRDIERAEGRLAILDLICNRSVAHGNPDLQEFLAQRLKYHRKITRFEEILAVMERRGYLLTDLEKGVVHFIARRGGESVLLCWREGEKEITHWHELDGDAPDEGARRNLESWND